MKIFHTTDLHYNKKWNEWVSSQQDNFDVFCITGDFLEETKKESIKDQIKWVSGWIKSFKKPLLVCSGNHDISDFENEDWLSKIPNICGDNKILKINNIKFGCIPYIAPDFERFDWCDVLLYHLPPFKTKTSVSFKSNADWGDKDFLRILKNKILSPKIVLCGHMHDPKNSKDKINNTIIYNPGYAEDRDVPNHKIIDI